MTQCDRVMASKRGERAYEQFTNVQSRIIEKLGGMDTTSDFVVDDWIRAEGGGGRTCVIQGGDFIEKGGVNVSRVHGQMSEAFSAQVPGEGRQFFATGVSLIIHPKNPHVPTVHANFRYIEKGEGEGARSWFGGGADLTPWILYEEDARHFHQTWKDTCGRHGIADFGKLQKWCDEYFYLPHRGETRGVGGIFYDYLSLADHPQGTPGTIEEAEAFTFDASNSFLDAYLPIAERRKPQEWTESERQWQLVRRGRYVEFNLIYDRGTTFGLKTGGRVESILVSLPNPVSWEYMHEPEEGTYQSELVDALKNPRDWLAHG